MPLPSNKEIQTPDIFETGINYEIVLMRILRLNWKLLTLNYFSRLKFNQWMQLLEEKIHLES